ncbi:ANKRD16 [Bugula neritina]|uniref:ANKRD16 n=1 Tax=Bugula neritina TaxID=10212 RepID=A0A7J7KA19_BUGNE|nr:ANKRD16 [Bugula neritina]
MLLDQDIQIVSFLLDEAPSCWDTSSKNGRTPLHTAAIHGRVECLKLMLSTRCQYDINCKDSCGSTPLMDAIRKDHSSVVNLLLLNDASAHSENILQRNCMHVAAEAGSLNSLPILQNYITTEAMPGIVNSPDCNGTRPLHLASKEGHSDMLRSLMSIGADPHLQDANGRNALHVAKLFKQEKCVELLHEHSENRKIENG